MAGPCTSGFWMWMVLILIASTATVTGQVCQDPLGMESGAIPDGSITASSYYYHEYRPYYARLNGVRSYGCWLSGGSSVGQWLQVDLGEMKRVTGTIIQGQQRGAERWVTSYKIRYSADQTVWTTYAGSDGSDMVFPGNTDTNTPVTNLQDNPIAARYVRFYPQTWHNYIAMRVEILGCSNTRIPKTNWNSSVCLDPLGMEYGVIPDVRITSSSITSPDYQPYFGRLYGVRGGGGWAARTNVIGEWLQVDLGEMKRVTGTVIQGRQRDYEQWVTSYKLRYSADQTVWTTYAGSDGSEMVFPGNTEMRTPVTNLLDNPIAARYVRFYPQTWHNYIAMSVEILGCSTDMCLIASYVSFDGVCYKDFAELKTYDQAKQTCAADGGMIAMPKNSAINTFIHNLARGGTRWIGLNDIDNEGQWVFEDGQTLASSGYANWNGGEPNNGGGDEDCAAVFHTTHIWNDARCTVSKVAFICQLAQGPDATSTTVTGLPTTKYTFTLTSFDEDDQTNGEIGGTYATYPVAELSGLTLDDAGIGHLTVSWTVVGNLPISRYRLRYQPADGSGSYQDLFPAPGPDVTSATVQGLLANTEYTLSLTSFDEDDQKNGEVSGTYTTDPVVVNVVCDQDSMSLSIPRAALPAVNVEDLHLLDPDCGATEDEDEDVFKFETHLQECGTRQETSGDDKFIFSNEVIANQVTQANGAVRNQPVNLPFQCEFLRQHVVSQGNDIMYNIPSPRLQIIDANNSFTMEMHMFTSEDFSATYKSSDFPLQVSPSDRLHFGLSVASSLDNLELFARDCVSTPTTSPDDSPRVSIIANGCQVDETLQKDPDLSNDKALCYGVDAFAFPNALDPSLVYFHCTMIICFKDDPDSRCKQGCIPPAARRRRAVSDGTETRVRRESSRDKRADITQGPFQVQSGEAGTGPAGVPLVTAVGAAVGVAGIMVLLIVAGVLAKKRAGLALGRKKRDDDTVGLDNYSYQTWGKMSKAGIADTKA
ncbi:PREDICTED: uncharacterized protein LOC109481455 [Branchiostoma belcheri]|uniref:Uncharacterized protein LOC109481455 n=1 Tax=Branchiostoma belcheri TaxID=7741 RepID=A0A6P4ZZY1_BRABE|nr:PREDICTED: uncharacterized protein LOC109481455 [Branchiostoma belcheri]